MTRRKVQSSASAKHRKFDHLAHIAAPTFVEERLGHVTVSDPVTGLRFFVPITLKF